MEQFTVLDKTVLENLNICANCSKQLNVAPIYCVERNDKIEEICGRCVNIADGCAKSKKWRQYTFENFSKFLTFPCSNKKFGCNAVLYSYNVVSHENICTFQGLKCPLAQENMNLEEICAWEGNVKNINEHVEESHKSCMLNPPQIEWTDFKSDMVLFTNVGTQLITIVIKYEKDSTYHCLLMVNGSDIESQCYRYQLELFDDSKNNSIILRKSRLEPLSFMKECLDNRDKLLEIDLMKIKQMLKHTKHITGRFGIVRKGKKEIALITGSKNIETLNISLAKPKEQKVVDENMLIELECPVCNEHMIPPIFICKTGHSICNNCKTKVTACPNCRDRFTGARNFTLEKLTIRVNYPCRNRDQGCTFVTTSDKIVDHQLNCQFSDNPCILKCSWQGKRHLMYNHLKIAHPDSICDSNVLQIFDLDNKEDTYFIYEYGELFRFSFLQEQNQNTKFNIQHVGAVEDNPKFRCQLQIVDHSPLGLNISFTNICKPLTDVKAAHSTGISIPFSLLTPFIFETRYYYYKISVTKI